MHEGKTYTVRIHHSRKLADALDEEPEPFMVSLILIGGVYMDIMDPIAQVVSSVGFPIAMAIALFWYMTKQMEIHKQETAELRDVISENNEILAGLKQLIEDRLNG